LNAEFPVRVYYQSELELPDVIPKYVSEAGGFPYVVERPMYLFKLTYSSYCTNSAVLPLVNNDCSLTRELELIDVKNPHLVG